MLNGAIDTLVGKKKQYITQYFIIKQVHCSHQILIMNQAANTQFGSENSTFSSAAQGPWMEYKMLV